MFLLNVYLFQSVSTGRMQKKNEETMHKCVVFHAFSCLTLGRPAFSVWTGCTPKKADAKASNEIKNPQDGRSGEMGGIGRVRSAKARTAQEPDIPSATVASASVPGLPSEPEPVATMTKLALQQWVRNGENGPGLMTYDWL